MSRATDQDKVKVRKPSRYIDDVVDPGRILLYVTLALIVYGLLMVFSATNISNIISEVSIIQRGADATLTADAALTSQADYIQQLMSSSYSKGFNQAMFVLLGLLVSLIVVRIGAEKLLSEKAILAIFAIVVALLFITLIPGVGLDDNDAKRWIRLPGAGTIQPSEFAKVIIIMGVSAVTVAYQRGKTTRNKYLVLLAVLVILPIAIIYCELDLGTIIIIGGTLYIMAIIMGCDKRILIGVVVAGVVGVIIIIAFGAEYRLDRVQAWLHADEEEYYWNKGYQIVHAVRAIATGGFFGVGLGHSRQKYSYLTQADSDYVFAVLAEECGFIGVMLLLALYIAFAWAGFRIARDARFRSPIASYMCYGLTSCIIVQALLNIVGVVRLTPMTGRTLPFISSGGSSILTCMIIVALMYSVSLANRSGEPGRYAIDPHAQARMGFAIIGQDGRVISPRGDVTSVGGRADRGARGSRSERRDADQADGGSTRRTRGSTARDLGVASGGRDAAGRTGTGRASQGGRGGGSGSGRVPTPRSRVGQPAGGREAQDAGRQSAQRVDAARRTHATRSPGNRETGRVRPATGRGTEEVKQDRMEGGDTPRGGNRSDRRR